jgi:hypothetical protein
MGLYLTPIIVNTSPGQKGGVVSYAKVRPQIERLCLQDSGAYEFEALLFVKPRQFTDWADDKAVEALVAARQGIMPEDINDTPHTAPSKRVLAAMPNYQKPIHGPLIACDIGLNAIRADCPHFDGWLQRLEALMN